MDRPRKHNEQGKEHDSDRPSSPPYSGHPMTLIKRSELAALLDGVRQGKKNQVYLFFGERYLCREAADLLQKTLLVHSAGAVHPIDGDQEDAGRTLSRLMSFSLLPGLQIFRVTDSRLFQSKDMSASLWEKAVQAHSANRPGPALRYLLNMLSLAGVQADTSEPFSELSAGQWQALFGTGKPEGDLSWADRLVREAGEQASAKTSGTNPAEKYQEAFSKGLPGQNILILTAEAVDKRKKLFTYIKENGVVVDCAVETGAGSAAQKVQKEVLTEMVQKTLAEFGKKIEPKALAMFFDRVGFHPVAVVMETEKLALFALDRPLITCEDLETMVGRSREDALYELTDAFGKRQTARTLSILHNLLENGIHSLAILSTLRNYLRRSLIFRSLQLRPVPAWRQGMSAQQFQGTYLPALKETGEWPDLLKGHPYALYMSFTKATEYSCPALKKWLGLLLQAEFRLKGSPLPQHLILDELFLAMLKEQMQAAR
jgi:DNA polymerase III subunit delta